MTDSTKIERYAAELWHAESARRPIEPFTSRGVELDRNEAYLIQLDVARMRQKLGHRIVGKKVGLTSKAMQEMAGFGDPDYGHLFDTMRIENRGAIASDALIQPLVEAEVAFILDKPLRGPNVTRNDVLRATAYVSPALEIVDSRIKNWRIRWCDTVADNGSSSRFVIGDCAVSPLKIDFRTIGVVLEKNRIVASTSVMAEVLGDPVNAVCWLANKLNEWEIELNAGDIILPGSPCRALVATKGDFFEAHMAGLGAVSVGFT